MSCFNQPFDGSARPSTPLPSTPRRRQRTSSFSFDKSIGAPGVFRRRDRPVAASGSALGASSSSPVTEVDSPARREPGRIASFQSSPGYTPSSSDRAVSRSNTYSSGSAQPILTPRSVSTPLPPNKLVKRSKSQHAPFSAPPSTAANLKQALKRPATSHQRSATYSSSLPGSYSGKTDSPIGNADSRLDLVERSFRFFFRNRRSRSLVQSPSVRKSSRDRSIIQPVLPDGTSPSLLSALDVHPADPEGDDLLDADTDNSWLEDSPRSNGSKTGSRSSSSFKAKFDHQDRPSSRKQPRRSFSISSFLADSPTGKFRKDSTALHPKLMKKKMDRRFASAPLVKSSNMDTADEFAAETQPTEQIPQDVSPTGSSEGSSSPVYPISASRIRYSSSRPSRQSDTPSDLNSSQLGSEPDHRIFSWIDGEDADLNSDTVYDSVRTGTTKSSVDPTRPPLDTLFDMSSSPSPPETWYSAAQDHEHTEVPGLWTDFSSKFAGFDNSEGRVSASAAPQQHGDGANGSQFAKRKCVEWEPRTETIPDIFDEMESWDEPEDTLAAPKSSIIVDERVESSAMSVDANQGALEFNVLEQNQKSNLFDWSEQQPIDRAAANETPRPRTVHGKKRTDGLGTRSTGRRAPSGLHSRSQSVPAFGDVTGRANDATRKFGTWAMGIKNVTEDWDDDFDFGDGLPSESKQDDIEEDRIGSSLEMFVPEHIKQQQSHLLFDIGLLQEWGLQIEELKTLKMRAVPLGLIDEAEFRGTFEQVDAMIELADQENEDKKKGDAKPTGPQDPVSENLLLSLSPSLFATEICESVPAVSAITLDSMSWHDKENIFGVFHDNAASKNFNHSQTPTKGSEAVARSVIEALQRPHVLGDLEAEGLPSTADKVSFDTTTLKRIVPYVRELTHKVKQALREKEGLNKSPGTPKMDPPFSRIFEKPTEKSPSMLKEQRLRLKRRSISFESVAIKNHPDTIAHVRQVST